MAHSQWDDDVEYEPSFSTPVSSMRIPSSKSPDYSLNSDFTPSSLVMLHNSLMMSVENESHGDDVYLGDRRGSEELTEMIHNAVVEGKLKLISSILLERDIDLNSQFRDSRNNGCTLMHKAAKYQRIQIMSFLYERGASIESLDDLDATPLFYSAAAGALQSCAFLLSKDAQMNIRDRTDSSPLSVALRYNNIEIARMMILSNADVHYKVGQGESVLHLACEEGNIEKVHFLLKNRSNVLRTNSSNENCLFVALPHPPVVQMLCTHANENNQLIKMLRATDQNGNAIVHRCAQRGYYESLERIIQILGLPKCRNEIFEIMADQEKTKNNDTALHMAAAYGHVDVVKYILDISQAIQLELQRFENRNGDTPLHVAIRNRKGECVQVLKDADKKGRVAKHKNYEKLTPKALAESMNALDIWNYASPDYPISPSMLNRLFKRNK
jgi:ankyrin repeat protein